MFAIDLAPSSRKLREFSAALVVLGVALALKQHYPPFYAVSVGGAAGLAFPHLMRWPFLILSAVTAPFGLVMSTVVLSVLFYLVLSPLGVAMRWRGRDPLRLRRPKAEGSLWLERGSQKDLESYFRQ